MSKLVAPIHHVEGSQKQSHWWYYTLGSKIGPTGARWHGMSLSLSKASSSALCFPLNYHYTLSSSSSSLLSNNCKVLVLKTNYLFICKEIYLPSMPKLPPQSSTFITRRFLSFIIFLQSVDFFLAQTYH